MKYILVLLFAFSASAIEVEYPNSSGTNSGGASGTNFVAMTNGFSITQYALNITASNLVARGNTKIGGSQFNNNTIVDSVDSLIAGGKQNSINDTRTTGSANNGNVIVGGFGNSVRGGFGNVVIGATSSFNDAVSVSTIIGEDSHTTTNSDIASILGGERNEVDAVGAIAIGSGLTNSAQYAIKLGFEGTNVVINPTNASVNFQNMVLNGNGAGLTNLNVSPQTNLVVRYGLSVTNPETRLSVNTTNGVTIYTNNLAAGLSNTVVSPGFVSVSGSGLNGMDNLTVTNNASIPTNTANFTIFTTDRALGTAYTIGSRRATISGSFTFNRALATDTARVSIYVDQDANGVYEDVNQTISQGPGVAASDDIFFGPVFLQPGASFYYTNRSAGGATAAIVANSFRLVYQ